MNVTVSACVDSDVSACDDGEADRACARVDSEGDGEGALRDGGGAARHAASRLPPSRRRPASRRQDARRREVDGHPEGAGRRPHALLPHRQHVQGRHPRE